MKEYNLLTEYKKDIVKMESIILESGGWLKTTTTLRMNYIELKSTIERMSKIKANHANPFTFNYGE